MSAGFMVSIVVLVALMYIGILFQEWLEQRRYRQNVGVEKIDLYECDSCGHVQVYNNIYCSECGNERLALIDDDYHINVN